MITRPRAFLEFVADLEGYNMGATREVTVDVCVAYTGVCKHIVHFGLLVEVDERVRQIYVEIAVLVAYAAREPNSIRARNTRIAVFGVGNGRLVPSRTDTYNEVVIVEREKVHASCNARSITPRFFLIRYIAA